MHKFYTFLPSVDMQRSYFQITAPVSLEMTTWQHVLLMHVTLDLKKRPKKKIQRYVPSHTVTECMWKQKEILQSTFIILNTLITNTTILNTIIITTAMKLRNMEHLVNSGMDDYVGSSR